MSELDIIEEDSVARRKTQDPRHPWLDRLPHLPWWTGMLVAVLGYAALHQLASGVAIVAPAPVGRRSPEALSEWRAVANWGQYLLPLLAVMTALWQRSRRRESGSAEGSEQPVRSASPMGWREFETALFNALAQQGYQTIESNAARPEPGADRTLRKDRQTVLVRCKHWRVDKVTAAMVKAHCDAMAARGAEGGIVVTSGRFGREAIAYAQLHNVKLIDGSILQGLFGPK